MSAEYKLYKDKTTKSEVWYYEIKASIAGSRFRRSTGTDNKKDAHRIAVNKVKEFYDRKHFKRKPVMSLNQLCAAYWLNEGQHLKSSMSSVKSCLQDIIDFFGADKIFSDITKSDIHNFINWLRKKPKTVLKRVNGELKHVPFGVLEPSSINRKISRFNRLMTYGAEVLEIEIPDVNMKGVKFMENDPPNFFYTWQQVEMICSYAKYDHTRNMIKFAFLTGQRLSNVSGCRWEDVHINSPQPFIEFRVKSRKDTGKLVIIPIHSELKQFLHELGTENSGYLFHTGSGDMIRDIRKSFITAVKLAGLPLPPKGVKMHVFRASFITHMSASGTSIEVIQKIVGHANISTTARYAKVSDRMKIDAIESAFKKKDFLEKLPENCQTPLMKVVK